MVPLAGHGRLLGSRNLCGPCLGTGRHLTEYNKWDRKALKEAFEERL
jgi:hypothetical protein